MPAWSWAFLSLGWLLIGPAVSLIAAFWLNQRIDTQNKAQFKRLSDQLAIEIAKRLTQPIHSLVGARGIYAAIKRVNRSEFANYAFSRELTRVFPGVRGFGFIGRVERGGLNAVIAPERADKAPEFAIRDLGDNSHDTLYVSKIIEPAVNNARALGLDVGSGSATTRG